ncbi:MAG: ATP-binding cassette domain-containing protein [Bauldia sp.]
MAGATLEMTGVTVAFNRSPGPPALSVPFLTVRPGGLVVLTGPSGSGKTTLLHVAASILRPTTGSVLWDGLEVSRLREGQRDAWRREHVGLVFQDFHLIDQLTPLGNVLLPASFSHTRVPRVLRQRAEALLEQLQVPMRRKGIRELSRGERQRVAIARALLFDPPILLADEPTASLDEAAAVQVAAEIEASARAGRTVIAVSHDRLLIERAERIVRLERGAVVSDGRPSEQAA